MSEISGNTKTGASPGKPASNMKVAVGCAALALSMVGVAYAAVPLYRLFCQVTGYGGTTQVAEQASEKVLSKTINVRFDANSSQKLDWSFEPMERQITIKIGETYLANYKAQNLGTASSTGTSTFNVTPVSAGQYFNKIQCFCFTKQTLKAGEIVEMPVSFYIDPEIVNDKDLDGVSTITLSYTFFPLKGQEKIKTTELPASSKNRKTGKI
jgi:cytochrome c oxidase assembly protein subunit 11